MRKLPVGEALEKEKEFYRTASKEELMARAAELGMPFGSYQRQLLLQGARRPHQYPVKEEKPKTIVETQPIPREALAIKPIKPLARFKGDEEHMVADLADIHAGHVTPTYNTKVLLHRLSNWRDGILKIANLHRNLYPLRELWLLFGGDNVHGERIGEQVSLDELDVITDKYGITHAMGVSNQIHDILVPAVAGCITNFLQLFDVIHLRGVRGNHGIPSKLAALRSNWDMEFYRNLTSAFINEKRIDADFEYDNFYQKVEIQDHNFFVVHGDQIPMSYGVPWFGIERRVLNWNASIGGFEYVVIHHFHFIGESDVNGIPVLLNGTFCSDDQWTLNRLGKKGTIAQRVFGVHKKQGITWQYHIKLQRP